MTYEKLLHTPINAVGGSNFALKRARWFSAALFNTIIHRVFWSRSLADVGDVRWSVMSAGLWLLTCFLVSDGHGLVSMPAERWPVWQWSVPCKNPHLPLCWSMGFLACYEFGSVFRKQRSTVVLQPVQSLGVKEIVVSCRQRTLAITWDQQFSLPLKCECLTLHLRSGVFEFIQPHLLALKISL